MQFQIKRGEDLDGSTESTTQTAQNHSCQLRLDDEAMTKLAEYAEFFDCTPSYVVTEALNLRVMADGKKKAGVHKRHLRVQIAGRT